MDDYCYYVSGVYFDDAVCNNLYEWDRGCKLYLQFVTVFVCTGSATLMVQVCKWEPSYISWICETGQQNFPVRGSD